MTSAHAINLQRGEKLVEMQERRQGGGWGPANPHSTSDGV